MRNHDRAWAAVPALVLSLVSVVCVSLVAQQKDAKKLDKAEIQEAQALTRLVDLAQAGEAVPSNVPLTFERYDFFRAASGHTYVPFAIDVGSIGLASPSVSVMLRVVKKGAQEVAKPASSGSSDAKTAPPA